MTFAVSLGLAMQLIKYWIMLNQSFKFRGGMWHGFIATTWPYVRLEVGKDKLSIFDESLKREYHFTHDSVLKITIKRFIPIIAYGIRIYPRDKTKEQVLYFWYVSLHFRQLIDALKKYDWLH